MGELWATVTIVAAALGGVAAFVLTLLQIRNLRLSTRQLELSVQKLRAEIEESQRRVHLPSPEEMGQYGKKIADQYTSFLSDIQGRQETHLRRVENLQEELVSGTERIAHEQLRAIERTVSEAHRGLEELEKLRGYLEESLNRFTHLAERIARAADL